MGFSQPDEEFQIRAEERRALILLGLSAIFVTVVFQLPADYPFNFPWGYPFIHITILVVPFLETLLKFWVVYGIFSYIYFSNDWFQGNKWWLLIRQLSHGVAQAFEGLYLLEVGYVTVFGEVSFFLPGYAQGVYWFFVIWGLFVIAWSVGEAAFGVRGLLRRLARAWLETVIDLAKEAGAGIVHGVQWLVRRFKEWRHRKRSAQVEK